MVVSCWRRVKDDSRGELREQLRRAGMSGLQGQHALECAARFNRPATSRAGETVVEPQPRVIGTRFNRLADQFQRRVVLALSIAQHRQRVEKIRIALTVLERL